MNGEEKGVFGFWDMVRFTPPYSSLRLREDWRDMRMSPQKRASEFLETYKSVVKKLESLFGIYDDPNDLLRIAKQKIRIVQEQFHLIEAHFSTAEMMLTESIQDRVSWVPSIEELKLFQNIARIVQKTTRILDRFHDVPPVYDDQTPIMQILPTFDKSFHVVIRRDNGKLALLTIRTVLRWLLASMRENPLILETPISEVFKYRIVDANEWIFLDPNEPIDVVKMRFEREKKKDNNRLLACLLTQDAKSSAESLQGIIGLTDLAIFQSESIQNKPNVMETIVVKRKPRS